MPFGYSPDVKKFNIHPNYKKTPCVLYFLHINPDKQIMKVFTYLHKDESSGKWEKLNPNKVKSILPHLVSCARGEENSYCGYYSYRLSGKENWHKLRFNYISYVAIIIDHDHVRMLSPETKTKTGQEVPIEFNASEGGEENESFLDLITDTIEFGDSRNSLEYILMINHMKEDSQGNPIPQGEVHSFSFDILYRFKGDLRGLGVLDPGGDNFGPDRYPP